MLHEPKESEFVVVSRVRVRIRVKVKVKVRVRVRECCCRVGFK